MCRAVHVRLHIGVHQWVCRGVHIAVYREVCIGCAQRGECRAHVGVQIGVHGGVCVRVYGGVCVGVHGGSITSSNH